MSMFVLAITGDFNAGKSTVRRFLQHRGWSGIDCDQIVHALYRPGAAGNRIVKKICGSSVFSADARLNRRALSRLLIQKPLLRHKIEATIHPLVLRAVQHALMQSQSVGQKKVCIEISVYHPKMWRDLVDAVFWVTASASLMQRRLPIRKKHLAFFVCRKAVPQDVSMIYNNGDRRFLFAKIAKALVSLGIPE